MGAVIVPIIYICGTCSWINSYLCNQCLPPLKTDCHDITEILLKVALNTITLTLNEMKENLTQTKDSHEPVCSLVKEDSLYYIFLYLSYFMWIIYPSGLGARDINW